MPEAGGEGTHRGLVEEGSRDEAPGQEEAEGAGGQFDHAVQGPEALAHRRVPHLAERERERERQKSPLGGRREMEGGASKKDKSGGLTAGSKELRPSAAKDTYSPRLRALASSAAAPRRPAPATEAAARLKAAKLARPEAEVHTRTREHART